MTTPPSSTHDQPAPYSPQNGNAQPPQTPSFAPSDQAGQYAPTSYGQGYPAPGTYDPAAPQHPYAQQNPYATPAPGYVPQPGGYGVEQQEAPQGYAAPAYGTQPPGYPMAPGYPQPGFQQISTGPHVAAAKRQLSIAGTVYLVASLVGLLVAVISYLQNPEYFRPGSLPGIVIRLFIAIWIFNTCRAGLRKNLMSAGVVAIVFGALGMILSTLVLLVDVSLWNAISSLVAAVCVGMGVWMLTLRAKLPQ